jgi:ABC-type multidrug transport system ATPase subunit
VISVENVRQAYGSNLVLDGVTFEVAPGRLTLLLGGNGVGKSTLLRCLLGLIPYEGTIRIAGIDPLASGREARRRTGYMPQGIALHLDLTVAETLRFHRELRQASHERERTLLEEVDLADRLDVRVGELSGGQRQRLHFALALLDDPAVLLLDEPTASLDDKSRDLLVERLCAVKRTGKAILISTHARQELAAIADSAMMLTGGRARALATGDGPDLGWELDLRRDATAPIQPVCGAMP